ncbi:MAG: hypothetical protein NT067_05130, partial [Candidatus Diapherotrites archaeon]|nr:hypothetical protein [Candidatus Diapherotrites archaeon]
MIWIAAVGRIGRMPKTAKAGVSLKRNAALLAALFLLFVLPYAFSVDYCTGTAASPCHKCDVNTFQFKLRDPYDVNDTRGWVSMAFSSGECSSCSASCTETWTKASDYNFCTKEGVYDIKSQSYNQGTAWFWTESDWNTAYTVNWDNDSSWCACKGGTWISAATYCGSLGCQGGQCCGDDNSNDSFCASGSGSCVNGTYYSNHCTDGVKNCDENDVDVGGADCWASCTGTAASPCHKCDVKDINFIIRAPDDTTTSGWQTMTYSTESGTCTAAPGVTETYIKNYGYTFCSQEGAYDIEVKSNSQGDTYFTEGSGWNLNFYDVNWDTDANWCACKGGTWMSAWTGGT